MVKLRRAKSDYHKSQEWFPLRGIKALIREKHVRAESRVL